MMNIHQKQQHVHIVEENMSNLTSASGEASISASSNMNDTTTGGIFIPQNQNPHHQQQIKKKRNQAGNPGLDHSLYIYPN